MAAVAMNTDTIEVGQPAVADGCDPQVAANHLGVVVTMYGRPFQLTERAARALAFELVSTLEEMDRKRRC